MRIAQVVALLWLAAAPVRPQATVIPWAWERNEDLRFAGPGATVAWYAGILTLEGDRVVVEPRRNPLLLPPRAHRVAVIRIETRRATLSEQQRKATLAAIVRLHRKAEELQIDFDATTSERDFYRTLLDEVRRSTRARLSITALASWCLGDRWMKELPVDEAVPMLFRMGRDEREVRAALETRRDFPEPLCRGSAGISLDEPLPPIPNATRVWVFNPAPWTEAEWSTALSRVR